MEKTVSGDDYHWTDSQKHLVEGIKKLAERIGVEAKEEKKSGKKKTFATIIELLSKGDELSQKVLEGKILDLFKR